jgi:hypothetical protein
MGVDHLELASEEAPYGHRENKNYNQNKLSSKINYRQKETIAKNKLSSKMNYRQK